MTKSTNPAALLLFSLLLAGCLPQPGAEGEACTAEHGLCWPGLVCLHYTCVTQAACVAQCAKADYCSFNGNCHSITWTSIPAGVFQMGCVPQDTEWDSQWQCVSDEAPRHQVTLSAFKMMATEVTQGMFEAVMQRNPSYFGPDGFGDDCGADCPVESVTWTEAQTFCEAVGGRLPTEAQWEYAARAGTDTTFICGDSEDCLRDAAWYDLNSFSSTHPVGMKTANAWGLYDMTGNVEEWVADWAGDYSSNAAIDPRGPVYDGMYRVLRGGCWYGLVRELRVSRRNDWSEPTTRNWGMGFRCARDDK